MVAQRTGNGRKAKAGKPETKVESANKWFLKTMYIVCIWSQLLSDFYLFKSRSCTPTTFKMHCKNDFSKIVEVYFTRKCYFSQKNGVETIFNQKLLVNFTNNYKEAASNTKLNVNYWSRKTETVFSCKMYSSNLLCLLHRLKKKNYGVL